MTVEVAGLRPSAGGERREGGAPATSRPPLGDRECGHRTRPRPPDCTRAGGLRRCRVCRTTGPRHTQRGAVHGAFLMPRGPVSGLPLNRGGSACVSGRAPLHNIGWPRCTGCGLRPAPHRRQRALLSATCTSHSPPWGCTELYTAIGAHPPSTIVGHCDQDSGHIAPLAPSSRTSPPSLFAPVTPRHRRTPSCSVFARACGSIVVVSGSVVGPRSSGPPFRSPLSPWPV